MKNGWAMRLGAWWSLRSLSICVAALPVLLTIPMSRAQDENFNPRTVVDKIFPPIVTPKTLSVDDAEEADHVRDDELVLGVVINGDARAYPINTLTGPRREIINDELGGRSIAATW